MATPTLTLLNSTSLNTAETVTGWTFFDTLEPDIKKEGSNSITNAFRNDGTEGYYDDGTAPITAVGKIFRAWINTSNLPYMDTEANGGYEMLAFDGTTTEYKTFFGSDTYFGGWFQIIFDMDDFTTLTLANVQRWGIRVQHTASARNIDNVWYDALKYLDGYSMTGGTAVDPITLADIELADRGTTTLNGYGIVTETSSVYFGTGAIQFGVDATTTYVEMDGDLLVFEDKPINAGLYKISGIGSGTNITIADSVITAAGTTDDTRFIFDMNDTNLASFTISGSFLTHAALVYFKSGQSITSCVFNDCDQIDPSTATYSDNTISDYAGTEGAVLAVASTSNWSELEFISIGTGHAIYITATGSYTFTNFTYSGYGADATTDAVIYNNSGGAVTINVVGGDTLTVRNGTSATTTINNAVTVRVQGVTEAAAVKVIANETAGTITTGDIIFEKLADSEGVAEITDFNYGSAFDPSGLDVIARVRASGLPAAAIQDDNGVFTDETTAANSAIASDMHLLPTTPVVNEDRYLFGHPEKYGKLKIDINTAGTGGFTITWQYWNGATWANLTGVTDGTNSFSNLGVNYVEFTIPGDWATTTINSQGPYYYIRAAYTAGTVTIVPTGTRCSLDVQKYLPFVQDGVVTSTGLTVTAVWIQDNIAQFKP